MIESWRNVWHTRTQSITDPNFPFGFVQVIKFFLINCSITVFSSSYQHFDPTGKEVGGFPWIRWHQTFDVGSVPNNVVPNVFMAVALDLRDDVGGYIFLFRFIISLLTTTL